MVRRRVHTKNFEPIVRNGKTLLSGVDPVRRGERTADAVSVRNRTLYLCPSPLYGFGLDRLLERLETEAPGSTILCLEADPQLHELSLKNIPASLACDKKFCLTNICDAASLYMFIRKTWGVRAFQRVEVIRFTGGWQLFPELYDSLCEALRREIAAEWSNALTLTKLGRLYIRNALRNLTLIPHLPSITNLSFGEAPVLVLGAGPSLDETLDFFDSRFSQMLCCRESRPFKIICVDTCLGTLKDRGIVPDLVVILESQHWNLRDFTGCRGWEVNFAMDLSAVPASAQMLGGEGFLFMTPWTNLRIFERLKAALLLPAVIPPLGSVGLTAVELARRLTCGNIFCAGLDFSFTADKYHSRSAPGHRSRFNMQSRFCGVINSSVYDAANFSAVSKSGNSVRSSPVMRHYRELFEQEFSADPRLFDITGSGLPLGLKTFSMDELAKILSEVFHAKMPKHQDAGQRVKCGEQGVREKLLGFVEVEKNRLLALRAILAGETGAELSRLAGLVDECDYLWGHFPDYAGGGSQPALTDVSFLKRLRMEIDPALACFPKTPAREKRKESREPPRPDANHRCGNFRKFRQFSGVIDKQTGHF